MQTVSRDIPNGHFYVEQDDGYFFMHDLGGNQNVDVLRVVSELSNIDSIAIASKHKVPLRVVQDIILNLLDAAVRRTVDPSAKKSSPF